MAEEKENKVEETNVEEPKVEKQEIDESKFDSAGDDSVIKVDLNNPPKVKEETEKTVEEEVVVVNEEPKTEEVVVEEKAEEKPVVEEITNEQIEEVQEQVEEAVIEAEQTGNPLPEKLQKVVDFMDETGGDLQDYVNLNRDISKMDDSDVLDEYYRTTKSHLSPEERNFLLEDNFGYDEDVDDAKDIRKKKIALKEQVAEARAYLDGQKSKYYEDIKAGSRLTPEAQKAMDFFNRYKKENEEQNKKTEASKRTFLNKTNKLFNEDFKGFDYQVGDKKFRFNVKDVEKTKTTQSDLNNFVDKYVGEDKVTIDDAAGYHKSLFTAMNADAVAKHFYEQGRADAIKERVAKDKNIDTNPRQTHGEYEAGGVKVRVLGDSADDFKFKIRKKK
tara:strand:- start:769 stop:1932 length:1164 start_codon:yes stop_codon:yes gene_type:complete